MKNKKKKIGFTLIELLAVIIVLAIIALITTPIIFNVIENAKLKSLENSCYGVIDAVRTKYAEGLLNSIDGTVKLKGNVTEITVSGEQPIEGTWEIDNSRDSNNRGIKIKDVKFGSMKDYTCTNLNSDGTINSKVTCTKGGDSSNDDNDDILYNVKLLKSYDINYDKCMEYKNDESLCRGEDFTSLFQFGSTVFIDKEIRKQLLESGVIENLEYEQAQLSCFGKELVNLKYDVNKDKCMMAATYVLGNENVATNFCNGITISGVSLDYAIQTLPYFFEYIGMVSNVRYDSTKDNTIGYYRCSKGNYYGMPEIINVTIPTKIESIEKTAFSKQGIASVDFSKATNLMKISDSAFYGNNMNKLDLSNQLKLNTIDARAFMYNDIENLNLNGLSNLIKIGDMAFSDNKISTINLKGLANLNVIGTGAFDSNLITNLDLNGLSNLKTIAWSAFADNQISSLNLKGLTNLEIIKDNAFQNNQISNLDLSELKNLTYIGMGAFNENKITELDLSNLKKLETIEAGAFDNNQLTMIKIPNSVSIIRSAFNSNPNLTSIEIDNIEGSIEGSPWGANNATIKYLR